METHQNSYAHSIAEKLNSNQNSREIIIEKKWFSARHVVLFMFSFVWNGILLFFYSAMILKQVPLFIYLFTIVHATAGIWMLYTAICGFVNKTVIEANKQHVIIRHSPLPWTGQKTIDKRDIYYFYVAQQIHSNKGTTYITYDVDLITKDNKSITLLKDLDTLAEARCIEQKLETSLTIKNDPVKEEFVS